MCKCAHASGVSCWSVVIMTSPYRDNGLGAQL